MRTEQQRLEAFGKPNPETGELVVDRVLEKKELIEQGVRILHEQELLKESLNELLDYSKELEYDKKLLKKLIDNAFKNTLQEKIDELVGVQKELEELFSD
mgnify:FL=1